jgi:hypothetical protein
MAKQGLEPDIWLEDSALFLSDREPDKALRRWFKDRLPQMRRTVEFLNELGTIIRGSAALNAVVVVAQVYEVGADWVLVDYDASSVPVAECAGDPLVSETRERCLELLRAETAEGPGNAHLQLLDEMIRNNSASVHWSAGKRQLLIVGAACL